MNEETKITFLISLSLILTACATIRGGPETPRPPTEAASDPIYLIDKETLGAYDKITDPDNRKAKRNEIIDERILEIDNQFSAYETDLWREGIGAGIGTDWLQLTLSGLTATVGGEAFKSAVGAASTGILGAKSSFDKRVYFEKTIPAIMAQMVAEREKILAVIEANKQRSVTEYTLFAALSDLNNYYRAGTLPGAIQVIAIDAGAKEARAEQEIKNIRAARYIKDDAGDRLREFWKPDGKNIDKTNEKLLKDWMQKNGLSTGAGDITLFLRSDEMADLRVRAVRELLDK